MKNFKSFIGSEKSEQITEGKDVFPDVDVLKIDPDRADAYHIVQALMPTMVRIAYTHLVHDNIKFKREHANDADEENLKFDFNVDGLEERLDDLVKAITRRFDDMTSHDKAAYISKIKSEFKEPLTESEVIETQESKETPLHLMDKISSSSTKFESKFQFDEYLRGQWGVPKKKKGDDGKIYYLVKDKIVAIWNGLNSKGFVCDNEKNK